MNLNRLPEPVQTNGSNIGVKRPKSSAVRKKKTMMKGKVKSPNSPGEGLYADLVIKTPPPQELQSLLKQKRDCYPADRLFFDLIKEKQYEKVKKMVKEKKVDVNSRDVEDPLLPTPLLVAAELNDEELVRILLRAKPIPANVNEENVRGRRPIWWAAKYANPAVADLLLNGKQKCEVDVLDKETGCAPLYQAILSNSAEVAQLLIHAGANINLKRLSFTSEAETPLIKAVIMDNKAICEMLINSLCKLHAKTEVGMNALHYAVAMCRYDICEVLLENGIKANSKSNSGITAMTIAIETHNAALARTLLKFGYKMDKKYKWKEPPLLHAIKTHSWECAMTLLHYGCKLKRDKSPSYFNMAVDENLLKVAKYLAELHPVFLNEEWVQRREWPVSIYRRPDICEWLVEESSQPNSLRRLCRAKIHHYLGRYAAQKVSELPLPEPMKEFLKFKDHIKEKMYRHKPLDKKECPFDCPIVCSIKRCPPIEISSSESDGESSSDEEADNDTKVYCNICKEKHSPHQHDKTALYLTTRRLSVRLAKS